MAMPFATTIRLMHEDLRPAQADPQVQYWYERAMKAEHEQKLEFSRRVRARALLSAAIYQRNVLLDNVHAGTIRGPISRKILEKIGKIGEEGFHRGMRGRGYTKRDSSGHYFVTDENVKPYYLASGDVAPIQINVDEHMVEMDRFRKEKLAESNGRHSTKVEPA